MEEARNCGGCTACCTVMSVREIDKPGNTACKHAARDGCGIYQERPASCRDFSCLWLQGFLGDKDRPDRLGILFTSTPPGSQFGQQVIVAQETFPLGFSASRPVLDKIAESEVVILVQGGSRRAIGPAADLARVQRFVAARSKLNILPP